MSTRHLARSVVLQTLFEWDFRKSGDARSRVDMKEVLRRDAEEFAPGMGDFSFIESLFDGVLKKQETIDAIIEKAAPEWPIDKISITDRNVLRIGLYELLFSKQNEVPPKVAINEAIELAKTFSGESGGRFVNGVLGAVYRELGEPGKDETSKHKPANEDPAEMPLVRLGGAVVYARHNGAIYLALVHDIFNRWTLSKGKLEEGEGEEEGTVREIKEEIGVDISLEGKIGENEYIASVPNEGKKRKRVTYFLAQAPYGKLTLGTSGGLDDAQWFSLEEIPDLNMYDDILPIVTKGIKMIAKNN